VVQYGSAAGVPLLRLQQLAPCGVILLLLCAVAQKLCSAALGSLQMRVASVATTAPESRPRTAEAKGSCRKRPPMSF